MSETAADQLDRGIFKITFTHFENHPELEQMLPPFEQRVARLQSWLQQSKHSQGDIKGRLLKLIRHYGHIIPGDQLEQAVADLLEPQMTRFITYPHTGQLVNELHLAFESCYGTARIGVSLWQLTCRQLERDLGSAVQLSQPVAAQRFTLWIEKLIHNYRPYVLAEDMKPAVLSLVEEWVLKASEKTGTAQCLHDIYKVFAGAYASTDLGVDLFRLGHQHLEPPESDGLLQLANSVMHRTGIDLTGALMIPLHVRKEQLSQSLSEPGLQEKKFVDKLHKLIRRYAGTAFDGQIAHTILELAEQWVQQQPPDEEDLRFYLYGLHNCYIKYCRSDCLAGPLCQLIAKHQGADTANDFAARLKISLQRLQEDTSAESNHTERT